MDSAVYIVDWRRSKILKFKKIVMRFGAWFCLNSAHIAGEDNIGQIAGMPSAEMLRMADNNFWKKSADNVK